MGRPKALLDARGATFVQVVVATLREAGCDRVVVVVPGDPEIERAARATGAAVLVNPDPGEGPVTSLRLALGALDEGCAGVLYHPVDHPLVRAATVRALLESARAGDTRLVVPTFGGDRGHPAFFGRALFDELLDPTLEGGARTVVHRHLPGATLLAVEDPGVLADIDTPEAYERALGVELER